MAGNAMKDLDQLGPQDEIVGHKTLIDDKGRRYHEPLTRAEAEAMLSEINED